MGVTFYGRHTYPFSVLCCVFLLEKTGIGLDTGTAYGAAIQAWVLFECWLIYSWGLLVFPSFGRSEGVGIPTAVQVGNP